MLVTNSSGRVNFKTCFPGWYRGRTIHFHVRVTDPLAGGRDNIFGSGGSQFVLNTQRNSDNTMLAFQTVQIA